MQSLNILIPLKNFLRQLSIATYHVYSDRHPVWKEERNVLENIVLHNKVDTTTSI